MSNAFKHLMRKSTAALSIFLVLAGVLVSGHAKALHITPSSSGQTEMPCHHALSTADQTAASEDSAKLDLCRELCQNKLQDTATLQHTQLVQGPSTELAAADALLPQAVLNAPPGAVSVITPRTWPPTLSLSNLYFARPLRI